MKFNKMLFICLFFNLSCINAMEEKYNRGEEYNEEYLFNWEEIAEMTEIIEILEEPEEKIKVTEIAEETKITGNLYSPRALSEAVTSGNKELLALLMNEIDITTDMLNKFLIMAIDNVLLCHIDPKICQERFDIVKLLLENGADANYVHNDIPVLQYVVKTFVKNMLEGQRYSEEVITLIKLLVEYRADITVKVKDQNNKSITIVAFVNSLHGEYWNYSKPWVSVLKEISDFLTNQLMGLKTSVRFVSDTKLYS